MVAKHARSASSAPRGRFFWTLTALLLVLVVSVPALVWFAHTWVLTPDGSWYLLQGWNIVSGRGQTGEDGSPVVYRGPVLPAVIGLVMLIFGRDVDVAVWAVRALAVVNPLLVYFLVRRVSGWPVAGLLAAALVALFGYHARLSQAFNIDAPMLTVYLLAFLALLGAVRRDSALLALLSGLLLGAAILTKETAFVGLPIGLITTLLLGWNLRGFLLHYAGVLVVCLPWWIRVWRIGGEIYLVGRMPPDLVYPTVLAGPFVLALAAVLLYALHKSGALARLLGSPRRRRLIAWVVVVGWVVSFSALLFVKSSIFGIGGPVSLTAYVIQELLPVTALLPALPVALAYLVWKAVRGEGLWEIYLILLLLHVPTSLLAFVEAWNQRQYIIPQTLLLGALAALTVEVCMVAASGRGARRWLGGAVAALLAVFMLASATSEVRAMVRDPGPLAKRASDENAEAVREMGTWVAENVPRGETVFTTHLYRRQLAFRADARHQWVDFEVDCEKGWRVVRAARCNPGEGIARSPVRPAVWFLMGRRCDQAAALSVPNLLQQMDETGSEYLMITNGPPHVEPWAWTPGLVQSGAFEVAHASPLLDSDPRTGVGSGLFLLKRTGQQPAPTPARMDARTLLQLVECRKADRGPGYAQGIRDTFPAGIELQSLSTIHGNPGGKVRKTVLAQEQLKRIYGGDAR